MKMKGDAQIFKHGKYFVHGKDYYQVLYQM